MSHSHITAILNQTDSFPALPATVNRVIEITGNPESSANDLMQAILPDQSMCTAILKLANSAFFGRPRKVASIEEAIVVLGFQEIRNIILTHAIFNSFQRLKNTSKQDIDALWLHSLTCGLAAKIIAAHTTGYSESKLFIAGLIHDIGKLAILMALPNSYNHNLEQMLSEQLQDTFFPEEEEKIGISHTTVGMRLLNRWLFPEQLCASAGYHHRPETAPGDAAFPLIIQMANILSHIVHADETMSGQEILELIEKSNPEAALLWNRYNFHWQQEDIEVWLTALRTDIEDGTLLSIFNE
ncbi:MAG: HDOD domain-containing protein [Desulfocapsaceae bacterium]|nr:HDOD domain-containing protein [Desulfocapsaceae bacterium]